MQAAQRAASDEDKLWFDGLVDKGGERRIPDAFNTLEDFQRWVVNTFREFWQRSCPKDGASLLLSRAVPLSVFLLSEHFLNSMGVTARLKESINLTAQKMLFAVLILWIVLIYVLSASFGYDTIPGRHAL